MRSRRGRSEDVPSGGEGTGDSARAIGPSAISSRGSDVPVSE
jgi:hypothetical protein